MGEAKRTAAAKQERERRLVQTQHILMALVREHGRVRVKSGDLSGVGKGAALRFEGQENGDLVITYVEAAKP